MPSKGLDEGDSADAACTCGALRSVKVNTPTCIDQLQSQGFVRARVDGESD